MTSVHRLGPQRLKPVDQPVDLPMHVNRAFIEQGSENVYLSLHGFIGRPCSSSAQRLSAGYDLSGNFGRWKHGHDVRAETGARQ